MMASAEDLVELCTTTESVDVCMESLNEKFPGTESPCPENKPGEERCHRVEQDSGARDGTSSTETESYP